MNIKIRCDALFPIRKHCTSDNTHINVNIILHNFIIQSCQITIKHPSPYALPVGMAPIKSYKPGVPGRNLNMVIPPTRLKDSKYRPLSGTGGQKTTRRSGNNSMSQGEPPTNNSGDRKSSSRSVNKPDGASNKSKGMSTKALEDLIEDLIHDTRPNSVTDLTDCQAKDKRNCSKFKGDGKSDRLRNSNSNSMFTRRSILKRDALKDHIEYQVDQPIRVAVRLEYLMGNKIAYLNDINYVHRLYLAITNEEERIHNQITLAREEREKARVRKLVLEGKMDPPPGMEDLKDHPIFKVNKMLSAMDKLEKSFAESPIQVDERLTPVEPFEFDDGGMFFKHLHEDDEFGFDSSGIMSGSSGRENVPTNGGLRKRTRVGSDGVRESSANKSAKLSKGSTPRGSDDSAREHRRKTKASSANNFALAAKAVTWKQRKLFEEQQEEMKEQQRQKDLEVVKKKKVNQRLEVYNKDSLFDDDRWKGMVSSVRLPGEEGEPGDSFIPMEDEQFMKMSVPELEPGANEKLSGYQPYENQLITQYIDDAPDARSMFQNAEEIRHMYFRENLVADDFIKDLQKLINSAPGPGGNDKS